MKTLSLSNLEVLSSLNQNDKIICLDDFVTGNKGDIVFFRGAKHDGELIYISRSLNGPNEDLYYSSRFGKPCKKKLG